MSSGVYRSFVRVPGGWGHAEPARSSGAGAPGCGHHPSGWPAARGRGAWAGPRGAGARHGSDHALPAAGPAHPACSAAAPRAARDLTCPSRIA